MKYVYISGLNVLENFFIDDRRDFKGTNCWHLTHGLYRMWRLTFHQARWLQRKHESISVTISVSLHAVVLKHWWTVERWSEEKVTIPIHWCHPTRRFLYSGTTKNINNDYDDDVDDYNHDDENYHHYHQYHNRYRPPTVYNVVMRVEETGFTGYLSSVTNHNEDLTQTILHAVTMWFQLDAILQ